MKDPRAYYKELMNMINADLANVVTDEFPPNLYDPMKYVLSSEGKRFRPILLIMACEICWGYIKKIP